MKRKAVLPEGLIARLALLAALVSLMVLVGQARQLAAAATSEVAGTGASGVAQSNPIVLILDASGSMWGQIDGKAKITIAKETLKGVIDGLPPDLQVGLFAYGHRREGDCNDIEMLIPVSQLNAAAMKAKIDAISPKGKTPLSDAVKQAAEALRYTERRGTVVLVSDGLETCNADPCALAAELARAGVDFKVHVIGFDISREDQGRLRCLADKTGGLFLAAADAQSLRAALSQTIAKAQEPPPPVVEAPGTALVKGPATVPAGSAFDVDWEGPDSHKDYIAIAAKSAKDLEYKDYAYTEQGNPARLIAPGKPGPYELRYVHAHTSKVIGRADIQVTPVQASVQPPATASAASEFSVPWQGPSYEIDYITIADSAAPAGSYDNYTYTRNGNPAKLKAPAEPGTYEVRYILGNGTLVLARAPIVIGAVSAEVHPPAFAGAAAQFEVTWLGPDNDGDYISIAQPAAAAGSYDNYAYTRNGNPAKLKAPADPGTYEVRYIQAHGTRMLAKAPMAVQAVSAEVHPPAFAGAAAQFEVSWQGPDNDGDYISIAQPAAAAGSYDNYAYTRNGNPAKLRAPAQPGTCEVRYIQAHGTRLLAKAPMVVQAVIAEVRPPVSVQAGAVFQVSWQGPDNDGDYLTVAEPADSPGDYDNYAYTRNGNPAELIAPSAPGNYEVRYIMDKETTQLAAAPVSVTAVTAQVKAPESVDAEADFEVTWTGPNYSGDYVTIAEVDADATEYGSYAYTKDGSPSRLKAPQEPGRYEVRYIMDRDRTILGRTPITVK